MNWPAVRLGDIVELKYGRSLKADSRLPGAFSVMGSNGEVGTHAAGLSLGETVVIGRKGSIGRLAYAPTSCWPIDTTYFVDATSTEQDIRWLYWQMHLLGFDQMNKSAAIPGLNRDDVYRTMIPLPPLPEQRRIAAILDQVDDLRRDRQRSIAAHFDVVSSVFIEMFGEPLRPSKSWPIHKLGDVASTRLGKMLDAGKQSGDHLRPYLRNANVQWFEFDLRSVASMDIRPSEQTEYALDVGDVLICEGGQPGRAAIWRTPGSTMYFQKALHRVRPKPQLLNADYLVWVLWHLAQEPTFGGLVTSATIAHLTGEKLRALDVALPPIEDQRLFSQMAVDLEALHELRIAHLAKLDELFASLQHRAFNGEL